MAKDTKGPRGNNGKFDPDSVEELTDEEMAKVQGGLSTEKSVATTSYLQRSDPDDPAGGGGVSVVTSFIDVYGVDKKPAGKTGKKGS